MRDAYDQPPEAMAIDGEVVILGPGAISYSMTPAAARAACERMSAAVEAALEQGASRNTLSQTRDADGQALAERSSLLSPAND